MYLNIDPGYSVFQRWKGIGTSCWWFADASLRICRSTRESFRVSRSSDPFLSLRLAQRHQENQEFRNCIEIRLGLIHVSLQFLSASLVVRVFNCSLYFKLLLIFQLHYERKVLWNFRIFSLPTPTNNWNSDLIRF